MTSLTIEVRSRVAGLMVNDLALQPVILELIEEPITVGELIRGTVEEQVRELIGRRKLDALQAQQVLARQYLSETEVAEQAGKGAVRYPTSRSTSIPQIDPRAEVEKALAAFKRGSYMVLIDVQRMERLDQQITFAPATKVTFLRIMPLAGG